MSKIMAGAIDIALNGETKTLQPSPRCILLLSRQFGGLGKLRDALVAQDIDAAASTISRGLNLSDKESAKMAEAVAVNGVTHELIVPLIKFVGVLSNGGKPVDEGDGGSGEGSEGNGS